MTKDGTVKIGKYITIGAGGLMLGRGHRIFIFFYSINIYHIDCYLYEGIVMLFSFVTVDFYLFYDGAADMKM